MGVDLAAAVRLRTLSQEALMIGERRQRSGFVRAVEELGRSLDVGKQEGDGAGRQLVD